MLLPTKASEGFTTVGRLKALITSDIDLCRQTYTFLVHMTTVPSKAASSHWIWCSATRVVYNDWNITGRHVWYWKTNCFCCSWGDVFLYHIVNCRHTIHTGHGGLVVGRPTAVRENPGSNLTVAGHVYHDSHCDIQPWARVVHPYCSA